MKLKKKSGKTKDVTLTKIFRGIEKGIRKFNC